METGYTAVLVTYNRLGLLKECLGRIEAQTLPPEKVIVVDNASTDGTAGYLREYAGGSPRRRVITCAENTGGAGGFEKGVRAAVEEKAGCVLLLDDDALLETDYMEKVMAARERHPGYRAFAGAVVAGGRIDTCHRRDVARPGLRQKDCPESLYTGEGGGRPFACDTASFCGMVVDRGLVEKIGPPCGGYFIWHDDAEYSMRVSRYSRFLVVPDARLEHKAAARDDPHPHRRYGWREYYGIRNRILYVREHGSLLDRAVNGADMFCRVLLRNWLFSAVRMDGYDWAYEKRLAKEAFRDAKAGRTLRKGIPEF